MPYVQVRTNKKIINGQEVRMKEKIGELIKILGKQESWLMCEFVPECKMYFQGKNSEPIAYVDIKIYGSCDSQKYNMMTQEITNLLNKELEIRPDNIYVSYSEFENWGWNGNNF